MTEETASAGLPSAIADCVPLPWHTDLWQRLAPRRAQLPHALLLRGAAGLGKRRFARRLARALLCQAPTATGDACEQCKSCVLFRAGTHPDLLWIERDPDRSAIAVEQIRALTDFLGLTAHTSACQVVIVTPAEAMNLNAANALLKLLEEPPGASVFLLVSSRPARLPATVRSRCTPVVFRPPPPTIGRQWLAEQGGTVDEAALAQAAGAPLLAAYYATADSVRLRRQVADDLVALARGTEDPLRGAGRWKQMGIEPCLTFASHWIAAQIRHNIAGGEKEFINNISKLLVFYDVVIEALAQAAGPLDDTLLVEDVLVRWRDLCIVADCLH